MAPFKTIALLLAASATAEGAWNPANGTKELDAVEAALHRIVDNPKLTPAQLRMAKKTVADVDATVAQIQGAKSLTKQAKMQKVGQALQELQDLQGEFELSAVQDALHKLTQGKMTTEVAKSAKEVAESVDKVAAALENGKNMTKEQKNQMVQGAIQKLQGLQGLFEKSLGAAGGKEEKLETLEKELALKKTELARSEDMLKLAKLQKELATKKEELRELETKKASSKAGAAAEEKEKKEQEELVAKLVGMAKDMKTTKGGAAKDAAKPELPAPIKAIVTSLQAKASAASAEIAKMDSEELARERKADEAADEASKGKDAAKGKKLSGMLKFLAKQEKHTFSKLRSAKEHNLGELQQAIKSIENGDVAAVQKVMAEMQKDVKSADAKSHNFLY
jgi:hypothetical protein